MKKITLIDYGIGNLLSVARAFEYCGAQVHVTSDPKMVLEADRLVLPGVGAFADGLQGLRDRYLLEPIQAFTATGRPFLGICLGMQLMLETSYEFGVHEGLGLIPGVVEPIPAVGADGLHHKIPHIGWNALQPCGQSWEETLLCATPPGQAFYFVHSYRVVTAEPKHTLAVVDYHGQSITAVIAKDAMIGCQFHPEKSGLAGLQIVRQFLV